MRQDLPGCADQAEPCPVVRFFVLLQHGDLSILQSLCFGFAYG